MKKIITKKGKQHYDFDLNSQKYFYNSKDHVFLEEPEF